MPHAGLSLCETASNLVVPCVKPQRRCARVLECVWRELKHECTTIALVEVYIEARRTISCHYIARIVLEITEFESVFFCHELSEVR